MSDEASCLVKKLSYYAELTEADEKLVALLEEEEREHPAGPIYRGGDRVDHLCVVKSGWLFAATILPDARRQIVKVYHPGDVIGFPDIAFEHATTDLHAVEDVVLCPFPKSRLDIVFDRSSRLTALLFTLALRDQVLLIVYLRMLGRMSARERVAYFLLDLAARLRVTSKHVTDTVRMPLSQAEIGDIVGLTNVYVSKTLAKLEADGLLARGRATVRLLDEAALAESCDFIDRYKSLDTSWLPQS